MTPLELLTGWLGLGLMLATIGLVALVIILPQPPKWLAHWFGELSYPVYLIHPLTMHFGVWQSIVITLLAAFVVNVLVERPLRRLGRRI